MAAPAADSALPAEVESVNCETCGFTEDCTPAYIAKVRERYNGWWLCGLCAEAVKDEIARSAKMISTEEALNRHISFCKEFRAASSPAAGAAEHPISAMKKMLLRRSLESSPGVGTTLRSSNSSSALPDVDKIPAGGLYRSDSCFSSLSRS